MARCYLGVLLATFLISSVTPVPFSGVSWNVNGVQKLKVRNYDLKFLSSFDVVLLQETFSATRDATLDLHGFIPHHQLGRRHQWGLTSLFRIDAFAGGSLHRLPCPFDWLVVSRWRTSSDQGLLVLNTYLPVHSDGFCRTDADAALVFIRSLREDFPADGLIMSGDFNVDTWRVAEQRAAGRVIPARTRSVTTHFFIPVSIPYNYSSYFRHI
jgi:exonuclease III